MRKIICIALILTVSVLLTPGELWAKSWKKSPYRWHFYWKLIKKATYDFGRNSSLEASISTLQTQIADLQSAVSNLQSDILASERTIAALEEQLSMAERTISILESELSFAQGTIGELNTRLVSAEQSLESVQPLLALGDYMRVETDNLNSLTGPHVIFEGANVHVRSGSGSTGDGFFNLAGLGNIIIGYNEEPPGGLDPKERGGSHNLLIGPNNRFSSYGGLVAGSFNTVSAPHATVVGGRNNTANGYYAVVSGGGGNRASGFHSSVSGGENNLASNISASVSGGAFNTAGARTSSISGGYQRSAWDDYDWRAGELWEDQ